MLCILLFTCFISAAFSTSEQCGVTHSSFIQRHLGPNNFVFPENRLVGGIETDPHSWPWAVQLFHWTKHRCGGALIDPQFVVTAAHCFSRSQNAFAYTIFVGGHVSGTGSVHKVSKIELQPLFNVMWPSSYDVAVLRIDPPVNLSSTAQTICLPSAPVLPHKLCVVAGWGITSEQGKRADSLREIHVPVVPLSICNNVAHYGGRIHGASMMCAGYSQGMIDSCQGDSGGPLMCERSGKWELQGLVSWGIGCGRPGHPGVYSRITAVLPWIRSTMFKLK